MRPLGHLLVASLVALLLTVFLSLILPGGVLTGTLAADASASNLAAFEVLDPDVAAPLRNHLQSRGTGFSPPGIYGPASLTLAFAYPSPSGDSDRRIVARAGGQMVYPATLLTTTLYLPIIFKAPAGLADRISQVSLTLPHPLAGSTSSWCTWGTCTLPPRLYHEPLPDDRTLLGWTDSSGDGHVSVISGSTIQHTFDYPGRSVRGLAAHTDGSFAILLWDDAADVMWLSRRNAGGGQVWATNINTTIAVADFWLGDGRLAYGDDRYAAYFTVKGVSGGFTGHYGDQLTYVDEDGNKLAGGYDWGCSHSMAQLVRYHPGLAEFAPVCASDCYAHKGVLINDYYRVYQGDGNCGGLSSAQLGGITLAANTWKLVFSALDRPCCEGRGIGLATINGSYQSSYIWLTNTNGAYERDPSIARLGTGLGSNRYLVGWRTTNNGAYWLGVIDGAGNFLDGPDNVSPAGVAWGDRDDSFRTRADGSVSWVQGGANSRTLRLFRFDGSDYLGP
ncbi:MAG: hypothetical protein Kow0063_32620 [Anaerolineae bacterium]